MGAPHDPWANEATAVSDDDIDLPEPEHEHLLDHDFDEPHEAAEHDASGLLDDAEAVDEDEDAWDEDDNQAHWHDD